MSLDERATLTNMAVEAGGFTGIIEADEVVVDYLVKQRGLDADAVRKRIVRADFGARYVATFEVDLDAVPPMVATPGDPRNGVPLDRLGAGVKIDIAYGGSCTGGKKTDSGHVRAGSRLCGGQGKARRAGGALLRAIRSQDIRRYAEDKGYLDVSRARRGGACRPACVARASRRGRDRAIRRIR